MLACGRAGLRFRNESRMPVHVKSLMASNASRIFRRIRTFEGHKDGVVTAARHRSETSIKQQTMKLRTDLAIKFSSTPLDIRFDGARGSHPRAHPAEGHSHRPTNGVVPVNGTTRPIDRPGSVQKILLSQGRAHKICRNF
jgi:hypothetical protein